MRILVFGTFDHLHPGHRYLLEEARKRGATSVVVARDPNVLRFKGKAPLQNEEERATAIRSAYSDLNVMLGDSSDFLAPVRAVQPELILLGYDQKLPPGVSEKDFPCRVERLEAFEPEKYKSSLRRANATNDH